MKLIIDIPDNEIPTKQDILSVDLHFIDGTVCECDYPFEVIKECKTCEYYDIEHFCPDCKYCRRRYKDLYTEKE